MNIRECSILTRNEVSGADASMAEESVFASTTDAKIAQMGKTLAKPRNQTDTKHLVDEFDWINLKLFKIKKHYFPMNGNT